MSNLIINPFKFVSGPSGEHSYWRIVPFGYNGVTWVHAGIQLRTSVGGTDIAGTATSITDSPITVNGGGGSASTSYTDGNAATFRGGEIADEAAYVQFQFSSLVTVREVAITSQSGVSGTDYLQTPCSFAVLGSDDGATWYCYGWFTPTWTAYSQTQSFALLTTPIVNSRVNAHAWRIKMTELQSGTGSARASFSQMIWAASPGGATLCTGGGAMASTTTQASEGPNKLFDGSTDRWVTKVQAAPWLAGYVFPAATNVAQLRIQTAQSGGDLARAPKTFQIQYSCDGLTWTTTDTVTGEAAWSQNEWRSYSVSA